jgi:drug/metabolite transporter (DMT)-like permease
METGSQPFLLTYWPFLVAGFMILVLPTLVLLLALSHDEEPRKWSLGKRITSYWLVLLIGFLTPFVITLLTSILFNGLATRGAKIFLLIFAFLVIALGVYFSRNIVLGLGYFFGGLTSFLYSIFSRYSEYGRIPSAVAVGILLLILVLAVIFLPKLLKLDSALRHWGLGIALLIVAAFTAFATSNAIFPMPSFSAAENLPAYPTCTPTKLNPQTNQYEEDKECQKQFEEYSKKSQEIVAQIQGQRATNKKRQAWIAIAFAVVYALAGYFLKRFGGAFYGLILAGVIIFVYTAVSRTAVSTTPVQVFISLLGLILLSALTWQFPIVRSKR